MFVVFIGLVGGVSLVVLAIFCFHHILLANGGIKPFHRNIFLVLFLVKINSVKLGTASVAQVAKASIPLGYAKCAPLYLK